MWTTFSLVAVPSSPTPTALVGNPPVLSCTICFNPAVYGFYKASTSIFGSLQRQTRLAIVPRRKIDVEPSTFRRSDRIMDSVLAPVDRILNHSDVRRLRLRAAPLICFLALVLA